MSRDAILPICAIKSPCANISGAHGRAQTIADMRREFPSVRFEARLNAVHPLVTHAKRDPAIAEVIRELEDMPEWQEAVTEIFSEGG